MIDQIKSDNDKLKNDVINVINRFFDGDISITEISFHETDITKPMINNGYDISPPETKKLTIQIISKEIKRVKS